MRRILLLTLSLPLLSLPAFSQTMTPPPVGAPVSPTPPVMAPTVITPAPNPAIPSARPNNMGTGGPAAGSNSFTESQARSRLEQHGYTAISGLKKNNDGVWQGAAMRDGKSVVVSLDYKGDITSR